MDDIILQGGETSSTEGITIDEYYDQADEYSREVYDTLTTSNQADFQTVSDENAQELYAVIPPDTLQETAESVDAVTEEIFPEDENLTQRTYRIYQILNNEIYQGSVGSGEEGQTEYTLTDIYNLIDTMYQEEISYHETQRSYGDFYIGILAGCLGGIAAIALFSKIKIW